MHCGDVIFVREKGIISSIIRFFDKGKFNHVCICVGEDQIIEAEYNTRVRITEFTYDDYEIISLNLTDEQKNRVKEIAKKFVGEKYDFLEILSIWLRICFGITELSKFNSPKAVICSELVAYFLEDLGLASKGVELLAPNELYRYLKEKLNNK
jgi:uncharacterized protein YycO